MKINFNSFKNGLKTGWNKNGQAILAVVAAGSAIGAVIEAVKAGPKAASIKEERAAKLEELTKSLQDKNIETDHFKKEQRKLNWEAAKQYALTYGTTAALLAISVGCTAFGYKVSIGKQAVLLGAYKALELKNEELTDKVKEIVGEKKFKEIKNGIVKDHIENGDVSKIPANETPVDENGKPIGPVHYGCWDDYCGREFGPLTLTQIDIGMQKASRYCYGRDSITVNQIYEMLGGSIIGLRPTGAGERHGFISNDLDADCMIPYHTEAIMVDGRDEPAIALIFDKEPALLGWD